MSAIAAQLGPTTPSVGGELSPYLIETGAQGAVRRFLRNRLAVLGAAIVALVVFAALFGPYVAPYDPIDGELLDRHQGFSAAHPLGTDFLGRDQLSRLLHGARASFFAALGVTIAVITIATVVGVTAGHCGGAVDAALMRLVDMILAFPSLILSLALIGFLGPGLDKAILAMIVASWAGFARIIRGQALAVRGRAFIEVAECAGGTTPAIIRRHILPNVASTVVVLATLDIGGNILAFAGLSFLGLGLRPPAPEWGRMLFDAKPYLERQPLEMLVPGCAIALTVLGFNLLGDGLRDALDPHGESV
ncbi:MAG TPA: ABC transporter permease [Chloroflexota bacterium]|nr:ABC transporter permease [Chloroflexota bacterium]